MSKHRSVAETKFPFEYNKNIASRPKNDIAFKMHHLAWISEIKRENSYRDGFSITPLLQRLSMDRYNELKAASQKRESYTERALNAARRILVKGGVSCGV